jgi:hypothetical protein
MMILQEEMERLFATEVRRMHQALFEFRDPQLIVAQSYAHELQALWRRMHGSSQADAGVGNGEMLAAVRAALGRSGPRE